MTDYGMRRTACQCGHEAVEHYDSYDFCTWTLDGKCDCEKFVPAGPEIWVTWSDGATDDGAPVASDPASGVLRRDSGESA